MTEPSQTARLEQHTAESGLMILRQAHSSLRGIVARPYLAWSESQSVSPTRREVPSAIAPMIINLGTPFVIADPTVNGLQPQRFDSFVAGLGDTHTDVLPTGASLCIQVDFTPIGAALIFGPILAEMAGREVDLVSVFGPAGRSLVEDIANMSEWPQRFNRLEGFLLDRIEEARALPDGLAGAWYALAKSRGTARIDHLASSAGWGRKHLAARFQQSFGLTPKRLARVLRFEQATRGLTGNAPGGLAGLAYDCGYADQAHLHHDFQELAGCTPQQFRQRLLPDGGLSAPSSLR